MEDAREFKELIERITNKNQGDVKVEIRKLQNEIKGLTNLVGKMKSYWKAYPMEE